MVTVVVVRAASRLARRGGVLVVERVVGACRFVRRNLPLDNIVLDWRYWEDPNWGCHCFDKTRFADAKGMVDEVHALNARIMISVWPKFYPTTDNYKELDKIVGIMKIQGMKKKKGIDLLI